MNASESALVQSMSTPDLENTIRLCIGRVLRMGSRAHQPGDEMEYARVRTIALEASDELKARQQVPT